MKKLAGTKEEAKKKTSGNTKLFQGKRRAKWLVLQKQPVVTRSDLQSVEKYKHKLGHDLKVHLTEPASKRFSRFTEKNTKKKAAILINQNVKSVPMIAEKITGGRIKVVGDMNEKKANRLQQLLSLPELPHRLEETP